MYVFIDTEFTDLKDQDLISIGLVSEDTLHELYLEVNDYDRSKESDFVKQIVLPLLEGDKVNLRYPMQRVAAEVAHWLDALPCDKVTVVADHHFDFGHLNALLQIRPVTRVEVVTQLLYPAFTHAYLSRGGQDTNVVKASAAVQINAQLYYMEVDNRIHHALVDAKSNLRGWKAGMKHG